MQEGCPAHQAIRQCCAGNTESSGRLLLQFFWHYAFDFDTRRKVISIRPVPLGAAEACRRADLPFPDSPFKDEKVVDGHWTLKSFISIEDPFEKTYDVAHVLRPLTTRTMKLEMAVCSLQSVDLILVSPRLLCNSCVFVLYRCYII